MGSNPTPSANGCKYLIELQGNRPAFRWLAYTLACMLLVHGCSQQFRLAMLAPIRRAFGGQASPADHTSRVVAGITMGERMAGGKTFRGTGGQQTMFDNRNTREVMRYSSGRAGLKREHGPHFHGVLTGRVPQQGPASDPGRPGARLLWACDISQPSC